MAKAYWITTYRSISNPEALAAYAKLAGPAIQAAGGRFLARGMPAAVYVTSWPDALKYSCTSCLDPLANHRKGFRFKDE